MTVHDPETPAARELHAPRGGAAAPFPGPGEPPVLVSHALCPYVQRCAIVAAEKGLRLRRAEVDLSRRPDWFRALSPLGKVPLLLVPGERRPLFESDVICQYLDETAPPPPLLAAQPLHRARQRAWMAYASALLGDIAACYSAPDGERLRQACARLQERLAGLEDALGEGPWFGGDRFGMVDAAFAPAFRYFPVLDPLLGTASLAATPRVEAWARRLAARRSVREAVAHDYERRLATFLAARDSALGERARRAA